MVEDEWEATCLEMVEIMVSPRKQLRAELIHELATAALAINCQMIDVGGVPQTAYLFAEIPLRNVDPDRKYTSDGLNPVKRVFGTIHCKTACSEC